MKIRSYVFAVPMVALAVACGGEAMPEAETPEAAGAAEEAAEEPMDAVDEPMDSADEAAPEGAGDEAAPAEPTDEGGEGDM
ncbi:MAG TPA: hypothetical protein VF989_01830 [Polyangiaceae bacterium]|jgi:hypothetical protein